MRKDNPELNFNPGAADKWIELFCQIEFANYSSLKNPFSIIQLSKAQEYRIEIQLAESAGKQPPPPLTSSMKLSEKLSQICAMKNNVFMRMQHQVHQSSSFERSGNEDAIGWRL